MGTTNSIFSIAEVQEDAEFTVYLTELNSYATPSIDYYEVDARKPTINEIYHSLNKAGITILNERLDLDNEDLTIHIFEIKDNESDYGEDLTLRYKTNQSLDDPIESIGGIKTHYRILIKLVTQLTKLCGSMYILNPYESFFIERNKTYNEIWNSILKKNYTEENL
jgi:hypothetical protein